MSVNFSKKSRSKLNESFGRLRVILERSPDFHHCAEWNRFLIIERATELLQRINPVRHDQVNPDSYKLLEGQEGSRTNKELCAHYRKQLNVRFENLKAAIEGHFKSIQSENRFKLNTRAGILDAAYAMLGTFQYVIQSRTILPSPTLPKPILLSIPRANLKRKSDFYTPPPKIQSLDSSVGSISPSRSPVWRPWQ